MSEGDRRRFYETPATRTDRGLALAFDLATHPFKFMPFLTCEALRVSPVAMKLNDLLGFDPRSTMQVINILGNNSPDNAGQDKRGHGAMGGARNGGTEIGVDDEMAAPGLAAGGRRSDELVKLDRLELRPYAVRRTKIGNAAIRRDTRAREQHAVARRLDHTDKLVYDRRHAE